MSKLKSYIHSLLRKFSKTPKSPDFEWYIGEKPSREYIEEMQKDREEWEKKLNFVLRELIPKPIYGAITPGKLRYRGLSIARMLLDGQIIDIDVAVKPSKKRNKEWHFRFATDWTEQIEDEYKAYLIRMQFYNEAGKAMLFGCNERKDGEHKVAGILSQIEQK